MTLVTITNIDIDASGEGIEDVFKGDLLIDSDDGHVTIGLNGKEEDDSRWININLTKLHCELLSDVLMRFANKLP